MPSNARVDASSVLARVDEIFLVLVFGAAKHAAEHLVEHRERGVGENRLHLAREHDQRRKAAWRVEARDIAGNEDGDFPGNCGVARAMNAFFAIRSDAEFAHGLQPFDKAGEIFLAWRFRPFAQPCERRSALFVVDGE